MLVNGSTLGDIVESAGASVNIIASWSGLEAAKYMRDEFKIPYLVGLPVGAKASCRFINNLRNLAGLGNERNETETTNYVAKLSASNGDRSVLVIGEQVRCNSIRDCLRMDIGLKNIDVASFFSMEEDFAEDGDIYIESEGSLEMIVNNVKYDIIIGDPLYKDLITASNKSTFIDFPHLAVSSRVYWDREPNYIGDAGSEFFRKMIAI